MKREEVMELGVLLCVIVCIIGFWYHYVAWDGLEFIGKHR